MSRYIHIADAKGRDAEVYFTSKTKKSGIKLVTQNGAETRSVRVLKGTVTNSFDGMLNQFADSEAIAQAMISGDPEIDLNLTGRFIQSSSRIYVDQEFR